MGWRQNSTSEKRRRGQWRIKLRDSSVVAGKLVAKKSKTGAKSVGSQFIVKSCGQRLVSLGKSGSVKPLDLKNSTVARTWSMVSGSVLVEGGLLL